MSNLWFVLLIFTFTLLQYGAKWIESISLENQTKISWTAFASSSTEMRYEPQRQDVLRVYARNAPPVMAIIGDPKSNRVKFKGMAVDFLEYIAQHLNLTVEFVIENPMDADKYGSREVLINALIHKDVDLVLHGVVPSPERAKIFDLTSPIMRDDYRIMVKWPEEMNRWAEVARPFDYKTWFLVLVTIIFMIGMTTVLALVIYGRFDREIIASFFGKNVMYVIGIMTNQGNSETTRRLSLRILLGCWLLMVVVLINAYTGTLTSHMTVPKWKPIPESLEELAGMNKDYKITIKDSHFLADSILNASSGVYKILGDTLRQHPNLLFKHFSEATDIVLKENGANVEASAMMSFRISTDYKLHKKCRMTASKPISQVQSFSAALPKHSPYTKIVEIEWMRANEAGLVGFWKKKHIPSMDRCKMENQDQKDRKPTPITLTQLSSAFAILSVGTVMAILVYIFEIIFSFFIKTKDQC